jgi:hypothetical protein
MPRRPSPLLITFALLALGWAQVFGMVRGYLCECHGSAQITAFDHCHGGQDAYFHEHEAPLHSHEDHEESEEGETHEHEPVKETLDAQTIATISTPSLADLPQTLLFDHIETVLRPTLKPPTAPKPPPRPADELRRWPRVLTRAVALRI